MVNLIEYNKKNIFETLQQFLITIISRSGIGCQEGVTSNTWTRNHIYYPILMDDHVPTPFHANSHVFMFDESQSDACFLNNFKSSQTALFFLTVAYIVYFIDLFDELTNRPSSKKK